jgi:hypothetical protein
LFCHPDSLVLFRTSKFPLTNYPGVKISKRGYGNSATKYLEDVLCDAVHQGKSYILVPKRAVLVSGEIYNHVVSQLYCLVQKMETTNWMFQNI